MPTYEYECTECGAEMEIEHSIKDDAVECQPHYVPDEWTICNGKLKRLISGCMFNFKGGPPTPKVYE